MATSPLTLTSRTTRASTRSSTFARSLTDREADRQHPLKRFRPIASGEVSPSAALGLAAALTVVALAGAWWLRPAFAAVAATYVGLLALYSGPLKHVVILDVLTIAIGFVLRAAGGRGGDRRADQPLAAGPARFCWRCSWR